MLRWDAKRPITFAFRNTAAAIMPEEQSPFVVHDSQADAIQPAPATHKCMRRISHRMEEYQRRPLYIGDGPAETCGQSAARP